MSSKVLITGATGFVGTHLVNANLAKGNFVKAFVLPNDPEIKHLKIKMWKSYLEIFAIMKMLKRPLQMMLTLFFIVRHLFQIGASENYSNK
jgi:nucleoside-diphosphate-sugar epimerase